MTQSQTAGQVIRRERVYEKYSWVLLLVPSVVLLVFSTRGLINGYSGMAPTNLISAVSSSTPSAIIVLLNYLAKLDAFSTISLMSFVIFVAATSFRKGKPWAWYAILWVFVTAIIADQLETIFGGNYTQSSGNIGLFIFGVPVVLGLLLPIRKFFPRISLWLTAMIGVILFALVLV